MKKNCILCEPGAREKVVLHGGKWRIILADEAWYPGFCRVIWAAHVAEMTDLEEKDRQEIMTVVFAVEQAIRHVMRPDKVNLASFGNMVPHLHWHVIPRFSDDAHFPESVWGQKQREPDPLVLQNRRALLPELERLIRQIPDKPVKAL
ncbi:HIT family protein [Oxalobacter sp. OttesenSCG-928-P03]|nr:HIT family protein [Oxalobacter sp. OttesenSCG-928-P03]